MYKNAEPQCKGDSVKLEFPLYYSDGMVMQMGPGKHTVWGFSTNSSCPVTAKEECEDGHCKSLNLI